MGDLVIKRLHRLAQAKSIPPMVIKTKHRPLQPWSIE
jgi:hypothetical protein